MIELPFPPPKLSPNSRCHWAQKARVFKKYKSDCVTLMLNLRKELLGRTEFAVTFHPPAAHRYDMDGLISRFKAGQDALQVITGMDDHHFVMTYRKGEPRKGGAVIVRLA